MKSYRTLFPGYAGAGSRIAQPIALASWLLAAIMFASLSDWRPMVSALVYGLAAIFALASVVSAARAKSARRTFWILLGAALVFRLAGDASWGVGAALGVGTPPLWSVYSVYGASYLLFLAAVLTLVHEASRRILFIVALDAASIMLSVGMLAWYFALGPATIGGSGSRGASIAILSSFACGAGLLFIYLTADFGGSIPPKSAHALRASRTLRSSASQQRQIADRLIPSPVEGSFIRRESRRRRVFVETRHAITLSH